MARTGRPREYSGTLRRLAFDLYDGLQKTADGRDLKDNKDGVASEMGIPPSTFRRWLEQRSGKV